MAHIHPIVDTNAHFIIDAATRTVHSSDDTNLIIVQGDHNSEKVTFELPRYIENHDMSLCNIVQVHYINIGNSKSDVSKGLYEVTDLQLVAGDDSIVQCSWTISRNATMFAGSLNFVVSFKCATSETPDYVWNTSMFVGLKVCESLDNSEYIIVMYPDVLEAWRKELYELATIDAEEVNSAVAAYLDEHPVQLGVQSVNGLMPDEQGNVLLQPGSIGALPASASAVDALKLGNKAPECYLTLRNLLDNSDFRNPVNQRGKTTYNAAGYTIDRWRVSNQYAIVSVGSGCVEFRASGGTAIPRQIISTNADMFGKTYTAAVCTVDGVVKTVSGTLTAEAVSTETTFANGTISTGVVLRIVKAPDVSTISFRIDLSDGSTLALKWAALYEGEYTVETLPPYVPKGYENELLVCRQYDIFTGEYIGLRNFGQPYNLLDNSDFSNPVNQRGQTSYEAPSGAPYNIDRWYANRATITVGNNGIVVARNTTASTSATYFGQKIDNVSRFVGLPLTVAFMTNRGLITSSFTFTGENAVIVSAYGWEVTYSKTASSFVIQTTTETSITIEWAALYEGSYTAETLPPYVPKGYAVELAECQRYYLPIITNPVGFGHAFFSGDVVIVNIPLPRPMRAVPSLPTGIVFTVKTVAGDSLSTSTYAVFKMAGNGLQVNLSGVTVPVGQPCTVAATDFSLNLDL